ncbi:MAG: hypothetical protein AAF387_04395, partial [Pseudomonadota bacterium]
MSTDLHLVMHAVAIKKHASAEAIASLLNKTVDEVAPILVQATVGDRVIDTAGKFMLSPAGHMIVRSEYSRFCTALRDNGDFVAAYDQFE